MAPIRVGLIGLSTSHFPEPGCWAAFVHLPSILNSPDYKLVAIANSTVQSARNSIAAHGLPSTIKAYGSPEDLANEPEVDLVVVSVRVGKHFELTQPAILSKKSVFVEWPLGASLAEAQQLTELAQANGVKTMTNFSTVPIVGPDGNAVDPVHIKTSPDHIFIQGVLEGGAVASIAFRKPQSAIDNTGFRWLITGTEGEIVVTAPEEHWQMIHSDMRMKIKLGKAEEVEDVDLSGQGLDVAAEIPEQGANIALIYDAYAKGDTSRYATFESATKTHRLLEEIVREDVLSEPHRHLAKPFYQRARNYASPDDMGMQTRLPASDKAYSSGREERTCMLTDERHGERYSALAARVRVSQLFYQILDHTSQVNLATNLDSKIDPFWKRHRALDNDLAIILLLLPETLRLPANNHSQHALFIHILRITSDLQVSLMNPLINFSAYIAALVFLEDVLSDYSSHGEKDLEFLLKIMIAIGRGNAVTRSLAGQLAKEMTEHGIQSSTIEKIQDLEPGPEIVPQLAALGPNSANIIFSFK
ncbi:Galactose/lactose metabolism regulatory protein GAL80 [Ilyonectria robusta]